MIRQAVILAGGKGKRLLPLTKNIPKPMAIVNNVPFLSYLIYALKKKGIKKILILVGYKSKKIINFY
jgi:NDP-sugar pyrophosphorylase family protein